MNPLHPRLPGFAIGIIVVACFATGALVYPHLPSIVASHWDAAGQVNGTSSRFVAAFMLPFIMLALWGLWALLPRIDPIAKGFPGFRYVYDFFWILLEAFFGYVYALTLGADLGWAVNVSRAVLPALAILVGVIAALLPLVKRNWFFGIRTPWTLSSDAVWDKTHRLGAPLLGIAALCIFAAAFAPSALALWLIIAPLLVIIVILLIYSYVLLAREKKGRGSSPPGIG